MTIQELTKTVEAKYRHSCEVQAEDEADAEAGDDNEIQVIDWHNGYQVALVSEVSELLKGVA